MNIFELLCTAYKKLKSNVFFDKTQLPLRNSIVEFEATEFEFQLKSMAGKIEKGEATFKKAFSEILEQIDCFVFPKSVKNLNFGDSGVNSLYSNTVSEFVEVEKNQYFIDMPVMGHILGVAWILLIGYELDADIYENSYGNRLKEDLVVEGKISDSPSLFYPYFSQYESWRDKGLEQAKKLLNNDKSVIMFTLDFSRFFYGVNINKDILDKEIEQAYYKNHTQQDELLPLINCLTDFVYAVVETYSKKILEYDKEYEGRNILPIGFAPSSILSNYCLKKFDDAIIKGWNPTYYGRYVDDVLIIDKIEKNSPIYKKAKNQELDSGFAIEYYLANCDAWRKKDAFCKLNLENGLFVEEIKKDTCPFLQTDCVDLNYIKRNKDYRVNREFLVFPESEICLQNKKVKVFYFDSSQSDVLIRCFQKKLQNTVSEFRYMPEDEPVFSVNDYTEIYNIHEKDGPNKLSGVADIKLGKFELSKFLGKYLRISNLVEDKNESRFIKDIEKIFTDNITIENYLGWEKILNIFINNNSFKDYKHFINIILKAVSSIRIKESDKIKNIDRVEKRMKQSLLCILYSGLNRTLSLVWGKKVKSFISNLEQDLNLFEYKNEIAVEKDLINLNRKSYCLARMCDKYAMPLIIDEFISDNGLSLNDDNGYVNLTSLSSVINWFGKFKAKSYIVEDISEYRYNPYIVTYTDLIFANMIDSLCNGDVDKINRNAEQLTEKFSLVNYGCIKSNDRGFKLDYLTSDNSADGVTKSYIKVNGSRFEKVRIAVGNTELKEDLLNNLLVKSYDRSYERYDNLVSMVNLALEKNADMIVLPEGYLPVEWLPIFARTCAKNQIAAVVGLEHFVIGNTVYNITSTILPYKDDDYKFTYIHFHEKVHYAPHEKTVIESHGKKICQGNEYTLFCWNDFWFSVYCCYELASITDRALFQSYADAIIAVEWNMDTNYYSNIVEALARDLHCFCIQVNMSKYGDSRITQPAKTEKKDLLRIKGGKNSVILIDDIKINDLRNFQLMGNILQNENKSYKTTPPDFNYEIVQLKKDLQLWDYLKNK